MNYYCKGVNFRLLARRLRSCTHTRRLRLRPGGWKRKASPKAPKPSSSFGLVWSRKLSTFSSSDDDVPLAQLRARALPLPEPVPVPPVAPVPVVAVVAPVPPVTPHAQSKWRQMDEKALLHFVAPGALRPIMPWILVSSK